MKVIADSSLPKLTEFFPDPFKLTFYSTENELISKICDQEILICRSTLPVNASLLSGSNIKCIATASSGIDHIDLKYLETNSILLFDAKGCNATSVADYVTASLAFLETYQFIQGHKAGIIGFGETGRLSNNRLRSMGYHTHIYDPYKGYELFSPLFECNLLCLHVNLHQNNPWPSKNLINSQFLSLLKPKTCIINTSRGDIVNEADLLNSPIKITYCTDVYSEEPNLNPDIIDYTTLCTPHIAGHSIEGKINALRFISQKLHHHYRLSPPAILNTPNSSEDSIENKLRQNNWQQWVLNLYNPIIDTTILKQHSNKQLAFLTQRKAHINRHDFAFYY